MGMIGKSTRGQVIDEDLHKNSQVIQNLSMWGIVKGVSDSVVTMEFNLLTRLVLSHGNYFFPHIFMIIPQNKSGRQLAWHL